MFQVVINSGLKDKEWRKLIIFYGLIAFLLIFIASIFSIGYYHPDEYFQTIAFAGEKLGMVNAKDLPWEFGARIRPWLQPFLYKILSQPLLSMGIASPLILSWLYKFFGGVLSLLALLSVMCCAYTLFSNDLQRKIVLRVTSLCVFMPFLAVRTSSETLSGLMLTIVVTLLILGRLGKEDEESQYSKTLMLFAGVFSGLAFVFRYQTAFAAIGIFVWLMVIPKQSYRKKILHAFFLLCKRGQS